MGSGASTITLADLPPSGVTAEEAKRIAGVEVWDVDTEALFDSLAFEGRLGRNQFHRFLQTAGAFRNPREATPPAETWPVAHPSSPAPQRPRSPSSRSGRSWNAATSS